MNPIARKLPSNRAAQLAILVFSVPTSVLGMWLIVCSTLEGATLTFKFEASVASSFPIDGGAQLPFSVQPGDPIVATISFEPDVGGPLYPQVGSMTFEIAGHELAVNGYQITVADNQQMWIDIPGRIADPNIAPDIDINEIGDNIVSTCLDDSSGYCGIVSAAPDIHIRPVIALSEPNTSLLTSSALVGDVAIWNGFSRRELSILFKNMNTGGSSYVGAHISQIREIPEPSGAFLSWCASTAFLGRWSSILRQRAT